MTKSELTEIERKQRKKEYDQKYYLANKAKKQQQGKEYYQANKEAFKKRAKTWAEDNPDKRKSIMDKWLNENPDRRNEHNRNYYQRNTEVINKRTRELQSSREGIGNFLLIRAKQSARKKGIDYELDRPWIEELLREGKCAVSGIDFVFEVKSRSPWKTSIDRINPNRGYIKDNCRLVCFAYNTLKGIGTDQEALFIANALVAKPSELAELNDLISKYFKKKHKDFDDKNLSKGQKRRSTVHGRAESLFLSTKNIVKKRGVRRGFEFTVTKDWILKKLEGGVCEITGLHFQFLEVARSLFFPSIDRIDPREGYTQENCQVVLYGYNACKNINTHEDVMRLAEALSAKSQLIPQRHSL